jgi:4-amino-4-deoxy-L-arabinose transferase-like glycosyltransferase
MQAVTKLIVKYKLTLLIAISAALRLMLGSITELGNDEVYYVTYALYPDLSHFDHPPMIGWLIQLFTLNLSLSSETFIRLASIVSGTLCTIIIYHIGKKIDGPITGWYSALLYNLSVYGFVITGIFAMPDSPQVLFWLLAILLIITSMEYDNALQQGSGYQTNRNEVAMSFLLAGLSAGLALLSKYTSAYLIFGTLLYFFLHTNRFKYWHTYAAILISLFCFIPVLIWNFQNDFISFTYHSERIEMTEKLFRMDSFGKEIGGQFLYNNPIIYILTIIAVIASFRKKLIFNNDYARLLLLISLPLIVTFLIISLFRSTLPHWTGPAYVTLIPLTAAWIRQKTACGIEGKLFPRSVKWALTFILLLLIAALLQLFYGVFFNKGIDPDTGKRIGIKDITLDMYGWNQLDKGFSKIFRSDLNNNVMDTNAVIVSYRWFPAANIDYYVGSHENIKVITMAPLERSHKYAWITNARGGYTLGMDAYFISSSYDYKDPRELYSELFTIGKPDTIPIYRNNVLVEYFYLWRMKDLRRIPDFPLH